MFHLTTIGSDTKQCICEISLLPKNPQITDCKKLMNVPVWEVLRDKKGLIVIDKNTKIVSTSIDLTSSQKQEIATICKEQLRN